MKAVHFGAGNIGRGFIGLLLSQAGYEVCFVDVNENFVSQLKARGEYPVTLASEGQETVTVTNVTALSSATQADEVIAAIAEAREHGDLKENAEYHAAREQQGFIEARIKDIEAKLSTSQVINVHDIPNTGKVIFGTTVTLVNTETDQGVTYKIVGDDEANVKVNKISVNSPIARALIGKEEGDVVNVQVPGGTVEYEIELVEHK